MKGFEPSVSALTGQRVGPLHHTPRQPEVYHAGKASVKQRVEVDGPDARL